MLVIDMVIWVPETLWKSDVATWRGGWGPNHFL